MSLFGAMTASVAGLNVQGQAISVISDNLANTNTVGYKASRSLFSQMVTSSGVSGTAYNAGGVDTNTQRAQATQGALNTTASKTDLAITGNGYFRVADSRDLTTSTGYYYTRAGAFSENKEGFLVNPDGYYLQGWRTDSEGNIMSMQDLVNIELQSVGVSSQPTEAVKIGATLNGEVPAMSALYTDDLEESLDAILASNNTNIYKTDVRVYDAQGAARDMTVVFSKRAANTWDYQIVTDGSNIQGETAEELVRVSAGTIQFNQNGTIRDVKTYTDLATGATSQGATATINWAGGVGASNVAFNFGSYTGGKTITPAAGMQYADGVLAMAVENESMAFGTYTLNYNLGAGGEREVSLALAGGGSIGPLTVGPDGTTRELVFENAGNRVRVTLGSDFVFPDTTANATPVPVTFTISPIVAQDQGLGTDGIQQKAASFNTSFVNQDGFGAGLLSSISIGEDGYVSGTFTNGETKKLYKVAMAVFQNQAGLEPVSGSLLRVTDSSGAALIKEPGLGGTGRIVSGALEGSTTDIANEFSQMIVAQRAFQANSSVIQTVDQMLNNLLQLR